MQNVDNMAAIIKKKRLLDRIYDYLDECNLNCAIGNKNVTLLAIHALEIQKRYVIVDTCIGDTKTSRYWRHMDWRYKNDVIGDTCTGDTKTTLLATHASETQKRRVIGDRCIGDIKTSRYWRQMHWRHKNVTLLATDALVTQKI